MAALQVQLAQVQAAKAIETTITIAALDHAVIEGTRNMSYTVQGDVALQPTEVSDNGEFTVLRYPGHADIPSIFAVDVDGTETIVPYDVREDFVVIHAVYRQLRLRRGATVLCIYNEAPLRNDRGDRTGQQRRPHGGSQCHAPDRLSKRARAIQVRPEGRSDARHPHGSDRRHQRDGRAQLRGET